MTDRNGIGRNEQPQRPQDVDDLIFPDQGGPQASQR